MNNLMEIIVYFYTVLYISKEGFLTFQFLVHKIVYIVYNSKLISFLALYQVTCPRHPDLNF